MYVAFAQTRIRLAAWELYGPLHFVYVASVVHHEFLPRWLASLFMLVLLWWNAVHPQLI